MAKEDVLLQAEMGRLEIEPIKVLQRHDENPFEIQHKRCLIRPSVQKTLCSCTPQKKNKNTGITKKKTNKILKEPVLQVIKGCINNNNNSVIECQQECRSITENVNKDPLNLCTLVKTCNQLKISTDSKEEIAGTTPSNQNTWWKNSSSHSRENRDTRQHSNTGSCSQQALNPPCDVTIDELASYFETLVHIPKKMSSMAEMMYI